jgi:hypothetical protein
MALSGFVNARGVPILKATPKCLGKRGLLLIVEKEQSLQVHRRADFPP